MTALTAMRLHFLREDERHKVGEVLGPLGSFITGTANFQTPIYPLRASFYNFLGD
jgi:hypothetical protein